jgi:hypothetical protein
MSSLLSGIDLESARWRVRRYKAFLRELDGAASESAAGDTLKAQTGNFDIH